MSELTDARDAYAEAVARAAELRVALAVRVAAERAAGRTLDDIGAELKLSRSRVLRISQRIE